MGNAILMRVFFQLSREYLKSPVYSCFMLIYIRCSCLSNLAQDVAFLAFVFSSFIHFDTGLYPLASLQSFVILRQLVFLTNVAFTQLCVVLILKVSVCWQRKRNIIRELFKDYHFNLYSKHVFIDTRQSIYNRAFLISFNITLHTRVALILHHAPENSFPSCSFEC